MTDCIIYLWSKLRWLEAENATIDNDVVPQPLSAGGFNVTGAHAACMSHDCLHDTRTA